MDLLIASNTVPQAQADVAPIAGTPAWATGGNPATNTPATIFPAYAFNALQAELTAVIQEAGITLDRTKLNQLAAAIQKMTQGGAGSTAPDSGTAGAYAITLTPAPLAITPGMIVGISAVVAANTGASTLNINGLGALPIHGPGAAALQGGEFVAGGNAILRANATATAFDLVWTTGAHPVAPALAGGQAVAASQLLGTLGVSVYAAVVGTSISATTPAFVAPCQGKALVNAIFAQSITYNPTLSASASLAGMQQVLVGAGGLFGMYVGELPMSQGESSTFTALGTSSTSNSQFLAIWVTWIPEPLGGL